MKLIGIDYGTKRIGVAVSDDSGEMAFPKAILPNNRSLLSDITELIKKEHAEAIVIGESKDKDGKDNSVMQDVRSFVRELEKECGIPVHFEQEYFSSFEARRQYVRKDQANNIARKTKKVTKKIVDAEAAAVILNRFIIKNTP